MTKLTLTLAALICFFTLPAQNDEPVLSELLSRLQQNHMGSISDVFSQEEISVLRNHFDAINDPVSTENPLPRIRSRSTQAVAPVQVVEINRDTPSVLEILGNSPLTEFEGAGVTVVSQGRSFIVDNTNRVYIRRMNNAEYTDTGANINTLPAEVLTGIEVLSNGEMYGIGTNGSNSCHLYHINTSNWQATAVGTNNGLVLPINLARNGQDQLVTVDIDNDVAYGVDVSTGVVSPKGSIGFDANFGQGMGYEEFNDEILLTAFNNQTFTSELRSMNFTTGLTTNLGTIGSGTLQFGWSSWFDKDLLGAIGNEVAGFDFYPNPVNDELHLTALSNIERIDIFDITGKLVYTEAIQSRTTILELSSLRAGLYLLNVVVDGLEMSHKMVKQ